MATSALRIPATPARAAVNALQMGALAKIPTGKRGDVKLTLAKHKARYVRLTFYRVGWTFVDEVAFD